jgi:two-component system phosphate regulon response regulator PhoB
MHPHVFIIDTTISNAKLAHAAEAAGLTVSHAAWESSLLLAVRPDLLILSSQVSRKTGLEICRIVRSKTATRQLPVIVLTHTTNPVDRILYLEAGADDVVAEPFSVGEMVARIQAHIRRADLQREPNILQKSSIKLDRTSRRVTRRGREVKLGPTEYRMLEFLMENEGRALTRAQIIASSWSCGVEIDDRTVDVHIGRLRRAIDNRSEPNPIRTVRGVGYIFDSELGSGAELRA